ncbi:MAG: TIGR02206 family membrane protein [Bryobacteraceae bacterium]
MRTFGPAHISWLIGIALTAILLSAACRTGRLPHRTVRLALAFLLAAMECVRYAYLGFHFPNELPIHLCTITVWTLVISSFTLTPSAIEFGYFAGFAGGGMALLTPDAGTQWPARFFITHGAIIVLASVLVYGRDFSVTVRGLWRSIGIALAYFFSIGVFDALFGVNYMYMCRKPPGPSAMDLMGPWPNYLGACILVLFGLFLALWIPVRPKRSRSGVSAIEDPPTLFAPQHLEGLSAEQRERR